MTKFIEMLTFFVNHSWLDVTKRANMTWHIGRRTKLSRMEKFEYWNSRLKV